MNKLRSIVFSTIAVAGLLLLPAPAMVGAQGGSPADTIKGGVDSIDTSGGGGITLEEGIKTIVNVMLFILGAIAVIMIIIGGIRYAISNGDQNQLTSAKNTILYAVIGLIVAILAYAIVNFVIDSFSGNAG